jgi:hypothetical protein
MDEESPCLSPDGKTLYFSSKGHFNMGGFDIFQSSTARDDKFSAPLNMGYPLNTTGDNKYYFPLADGKRGYITLINEENGLGREDIYSVEILSMLEPETPDVPKFERDFVMDIVNSGDGKKISIVYDRKSDQFTVTGVEGEKYTVKVISPE